MNRSKPTDFAYMLSKFLSDYLPGLRNVSGNTVLSYRDTFKLILTFCKEEKSLILERLTLSDFSRVLIEEFMLWLRETRKNSVSTCNQRLGGIHAFFSYLQYQMPEKMSLCQEILGIKTAKAPFL